EHVAEPAGLAEIPDVADVQHVEAAVGEDDALALGAQALRPPRRFLDRHGPSLVPRAWISSSRVTVAVPRFMTTMPPAMLARVAASVGAAPEAGASVNAPMPVSPAPLTSPLSSVTKIGMKVDPPSRSTN